MELGTYLIETYIVEHPTAGTLTKQKITYYNRRDEIETIDKQIKQESDAGTGGPTMPPEAQAQQQAMEQQYPPEDNTGAANESMTPMLDAEVEKYSALLNRR